MKVELGLKQLLEYIALAIKNKQYQAAINLIQDCIGQLDAQSEANNEERKD